MPTDPNQLELDLDLPPRDERKERKVIPLPVRHEGPRERRRLPQSSPWEPGDVDLDEVRRARLCYRRVLQSRVRAHWTTELRRVRRRRCTRRRLAWARSPEIPPLSELQSQVFERSAKASVDHGRRTRTGGVEGVPDWVPSPHYGSPSEAPWEQVEWALRERLPWVQRFVDEGCPRGSVLTFARAYAAAMEIPQDRIPAYSTLRLWAAQYRAYGLLGLVYRVQRRSKHWTGGMKRKEADHG